MGRLRNGVGVGISNIPTLSSRRPFSPLSLFADGSQGVWYDDSNTDSMFQDSAGTVPAALESPVGKQLDLSGNNNHRTQATSVNRPTLSARYNLLTDTAVLATQSITTVATSYTIYFTGSGSVTLAGTYIGSFTAGTNTFTATAGTLVVTVTGSVLTADIRPTNQTVTLPAYQSVTSSTVYDTTGFPQYIKYNGSNQWLSTANINFTATAQISVFSGVRKLSEAISGIAEFQATAGIGRFAILNYTNGYLFRSQGTIDNNGIVTPFLAPLTNTLSLFANITAPSLIGKINNVQQFNSTATQGTGNYANSYIVFGARSAGASGFFNGQEFQTIIVGKTLTAAEIANTETYVNSKTLAY
jgi:hypothetical protein